MRTRIKLHFKKVIMRAHLRLDLPTYSNAANRPNIKGSRTWNVFHDLVRSAAVVSSLLSHIALILELARGERGGSFFAAICVAKPIYMYITKDDMWSNKFIAYATNPNFLRSRDLLSLAIEQKYKQEVLSGSLEGYIINEFDKAHTALKGTSDEFPTEAYRASRSPFVVICTSLLGDLPLMYCAVNAIMSPETLSISALAIHQQTVVSIHSAITRITQQGSSINKNLNHIKSLYDGLNVRNSIPDGTFSYPDCESPKKKGMAISVRDVSFRYPGPSDTRFALKNVSFDIPASSLVVIVGANGSGKSSLVNLLTRLHYPTSGTILVDGKPMDEYRSRDLRRAIALLTQDHVLFPVSVGENIAIGDPDCEDGPEKMERIQAAARLGGAAEVIRKLDQGLEEMTEREETLCSSPFPLPPGPLKEIAGRVERYTEFSGGEVQRLVASRTFMRISSGKVKLVVADEPTSAMDPEGEYELFKALRKVQDGMTMIFITHRFGHLTKHADLILCLKDGELIELGTHRELIARDGEYSKLFNIQASAFAEDILLVTAPSTLNITKDLLPVPELDFSVPRSRSTFAFECNFYSELD
ncbi:hypothetical protein NLI96_g8818 [Meripilus lineatus]|uniref:ABC transporter domain-containing protein n=1 Tax=Meripilus lineatus TaxID=2056292 RepID=A0AAD5V1A2_9APHY|nr:hypothetical protein NLI96_g8818 [Physisporinus lineatus]